MVKKKFEKKFLAQNSIINVDYENISDFVFTRIFFQLLKKLQVPDLKLQCCVFTSSNFWREFVKFPRYSIRKSLCIIHNVGCAGNFLLDKDRLRQYFSQECRHPWRETVERMGNGLKDDTYKSLVMRFNIFTLQIQISLSTEYICTSHILCFIIQCC